MELALNPVDEITRLVDDCLNQISGRELVSVAEMTNLLLDIRLCLMTTEIS